MRIELLVLLSLVSGCNTGVTPIRVCPDICGKVGECRIACNSDGSCVNPGVPTINGLSCGDDKVCNDGTCIACVAGVACTLPNSCKNGVATSGVTSCDTGTPECVPGPTETTDGGSRCDDGNICTDGDKCVGDTCVGTPVVIDDNLDCTVDSCSPDAGVTHTNKPENSACMTSGGATGVCLLVSDGYRHCH